MDVYYGLESSGNGRRPEAMRHVNDAIRRAVAPWALEQWDFFCECADATCRRLVRLSVDEYDEIRRAEPAMAIIVDHAAQTAQCGFGSGANHGIQSSQASE